MSTELGQDAKRIEQDARNLALKSDEDVSPRAVIYLIADLAAVVATLADRVTYGYTASGEQVTVR